MAFSDTVAEDLLLRCRRYCCLCHKFRGTAIEIHHIDPDLSEGRDDPDNGIPLCFDCHAVIGHYNDRHPRGRKYRPRELRQLRDEWFDAIKEHGVAAATVIDQRPQLPLSVHQQVTGNQNIVAGGDLLVNARKVVKVTFTPGPKHVSEATASRIKALVDKLAELEKQTRRPPDNPYGKWWSKLRRQFAVTTYKAIPRERGDEAVVWLEQQKARLRPKLRRSAPETWRREYYTAIYARSKELGMDKKSLHEMAQIRLERQQPVTSLKDLGERDLTRLHQILFGL